MISIIHPSRGRPEKSLEALSKFKEGLSQRIRYEIIISIDSDEPKLMDYEANADLLNCALLKADNRSVVDAINRAAQASAGDILIVVSDDTICPLDWDLALYNVIQDKTDWILKTQDGIQPWIITMPIMDRVYYNRFGYIYYHEYKHMFCDTDLTCVADITGRKITSNLLFKHNHYSVGGMAKDEVSARADATWAQGEKLFLERYKRNFDLPPGNPIQDNGMINWLKKKVA